MTTGGAEPVPDSALINEAQNVKFSITAGKTYLFHIINMGALAGQYLQFDQHTMTIVEVDGVYTLPQTVNQIFLGAAQRYKVIVQAKATDQQNFAIVSQFNTDMFDSTITPAGQQSTVSSAPHLGYAHPTPDIADLSSVRLGLSTTPRSQCQRPSVSSRCHGMIAHLPRGINKTSLTPRTKRTTCLRTPGSTGCADAWVSRIYLTADFGSNDQQSTRGFFVSREGSTQRAASNELTGNIRTDKHMSHRR